MEEYFAKVSEEVQNHLKQLVGSVNLPEGEDALEILAKAWLEKEESFMAQIDERNLEEADEFAVEEPRGGLIMTYSGSLLTIGPIGDDGRKVEYASVGLRTDVPESAEKEGSVISSNILVGGQVDFLIGPIKKFADNYSMTLEQAKKALSESGNISDIRDSILEEKILDFLADKASVKMVKGEEKKS